MDKLVTIGVPVYNEERYLDSALRSLRAQDYPNLEIVISDNGSTDATLDICKKHGTGDDRVRIEPLPENIGVAANLTRVVELARGEYFMWGSGHDLWTSGTVSECVALLEGDAGANLAFPRSFWIGPDDEPLDKVTGWSDTRGLDPVARFFVTFWGSMHPVMGVFRTAELRACGSFPPMVGADLVLLSKLALRGSFLQAPGSAWYRREFRTEKKYREKLERYSSTETDLLGGRKKRLPLVELPLALVRVVLGSDLSFADKALLIAALFACAPVRYVVGRRTSTS